jgi:stage V sporulation protein SpoVS
MEDITKGLQDGRNPLVTENPAAGWAEDGDESVLDALADDDDLFNGGEHSRYRVCPVRSDTAPSKLAFHLINLLSRQDYVELQSIGPAALSKAILAFVHAKTIAAANSDGTVLVMRASVRTITLRTQEERTAIRLRIFGIPVSYAV